MCTKNYLYWQLFTENDMKTSTLENPLYSKKLVKVWLRLDDSEGRTKKNVSLSLYT